MIAGMVTHVSFGKSIAGSLILQIILFLSIKDLLVKLHTTFYVPVEITSEV